MQATRALMICGILLGFFGACIGAVGMKCLTCLQDDEVKKAKVGIVGGALFIIAGKIQYFMYFYVNFFASVSVYTCFYKQNVKCSSIMP